MFRFRPAAVCRHCEHALSLGRRAGRASRARPETGNCHGLQSFQIHTEAQLARAAVHPGARPGVAGALFPVARPAQDDRQQPDPGQRIRFRRRDGPIPRFDPDFANCRASWSACCYRARSTAENYDRLRLASRWNRVLLSGRPQPDLLRARPHKWWLQAADQHAEGPHGRAHAAPPALRAVRPGVAVSARRISAR